MQYKILLVDDESYVIKSLKNSINWEDSGFQIIGQAENGMDAYRMIEKFKPDVVMTDVRMPKMSGLDLIKLSKENGYNTMFIVISGYAEFAYVQKALKYGAIDYCLKPFEESQIKQALEKAKSMLVDKEDNLLNLVEEQSEKSLIMLKNELLKNGFDSYNKYIVLVEIGNGDIQFPRSFCYVILQKTKNKKIYLFQDNGVSIKRFLQGIDYGNIDGIGISSPIAHLEKVHIMIHECEAMAHNFFLTQKGNTFSICVDVKIIEEAVKNLEESILKNNIQVVSSLLDVIYELLCSGNYSVKYAMRIYNFVIDSFGWLATKNYEYVYYYRQLITKYGSLKNMIGGLKQLLEEIEYVSPMEYDISSTNNLTFKEIIHYVNDHFKEDISIQSIANEFSLNPNYISQIFRKEIGITYKEHLTRIRIDYAKQLLKKPNYTIRDVSEKVGFNDYFYFIKVFKKVTGETPGQYKNK